MGAGVRSAPAAAGGGWKGSGVKPLGAAFPRPISAGGRRIAKGEIGLSRRLAWDTIGKMKRAVLSDIHGNLEALQAVLAHIADQKVDEIYCLGDIVGYGPNPCECLDLVIERCKIGLACRVA